MCTVPFFRSVFQINVRRRGHGETVEVIEETEKPTFFCWPWLGELFVPSRFRRYVDVADPFHVWECERGRRLFELPFLNLPKTMTVVSRTDLGYAFRDNVRQRLSFGGQA